MSRFLLVVGCFLVSPMNAVESSPAVILSSLVDPVKIDALDGDRAANPRLRKMMFWLETARLWG